MLCSGLVAVPLLYATFVRNGDAYLFLGMVVLAPLAGIVLVANSLFCLFRYRRVESPWIGILYLLVGAAGVALAMHFLPQFRM